MNNLPAVFFVLLYIFLNYLVYKKLIYPMLMRNHYNGEITTWNGFKKDTQYLLIRSFGWLIVFGFWFVYLMTFLLVAKAGGDETFSVVCLNLSGVFMVLSMMATSWPKLFGSLILRK